MKFLVYVLLNNLNGLIIQWGVESGTQTPNRTVSFPLQQFSQRPAVSGSIINNDNAAWLSINNVSKTGFIVTQFYRSGNTIYNNGTSPITWMAIGY